MSTENKWLCSRCNIEYDLKAAQGNYGICPLCRRKLIRKMEQGYAIPKCPTCGSINIQSVSQTRRSLNRWAFGINNPTARAQFECQNCGYKW